MSTFLEQKTKKQCITALIAALLFVVIVVALNFISKKMEEGVVLLQKNLAAAEGQDVTSLRRAMRTYEEHAFLLDNALIPQDAAIPFLEDLQRLAGRANVVSEITTIELYDITETNERVRTSPGKITAERAYGELYMIMATRGTWSDTMNFLDSLEAIPHHVAIQGMRVSFGREASNELPTWSAVFSIRVTTQ